MRKFMYAAVAALAFGAFGVSAPASARTYDCMGPAASCAKETVVSKKFATNSTKAKARSAYYGSKKAKRYSSYTAKKTKRVAKTTSSGGGAYSGMASYYWEPQALASGGRFNPNAMTAAHKTLPFGTKVRVTNRNNGRSVVVTINDRGPYVGGRIIDLSKAAARAVGMTASGVAPVSVSVIGRG
jgi:rare lipoprotein A